MAGGISELHPCEEGSDEHLMFCQVMEELESLCSQQFACFIVQGYTKQVVAGTMYQAKIKVAEDGETPFVFVKVLKHLPHTGKGPEVMAFKANQAENAPLEFGDMDGVVRTCLEVVEEPAAANTENAAAGGNEEMKDESQPATEEAQQPQG